MKIYLHRSIKTLQFLTPGLNPKMFNVTLRYFSFFTPHASSIGQITRFSYMLFLYNKGFSCMLFLYNKGFFYMLSLSLLQFHAKSETYVTQESLFYNNVQSIFIKSHRGVQYFSKKLRTVETKVGQRFNVIREWWNFEICI